MINGRFGFSYSSDSLPFNISIVAKWVILWRRHECLT
jgi:hypothetical protein